MTMNKVWIIARHEYKVTARRRGFLFMTTLIPVIGLIILLVATFFGGQASDFLESQFEPEPGLIGVVDYSGALDPMLPGFEEGFRAFSDEESGRDAIREGEITHLFIIPPDYVQTGSVVVVSKDGGIQSAEIDDFWYVRNFFVQHMVRDELDPAVRNRLVRPIRPVPVSLDADVGSEAGSVLSFLIPYFFGILFIVTIFTASGYLLQGVAEEKASRVIEVILSSVSAQELLAGKVLGLGAVGLTQVLVWIVSIVALSSGATNLLDFSLDFLARPEILVLAVAYYLIGFLLYAVLMGSVGALGSTQQESQQLASIFSMMAAVPLMLSSFLFANPNMLLGRILSWFPFTAPTMMLMRLTSPSVLTIDIIASLVLPILTIPLVMWAGAKVFRMGLLMYGKRPSVKQVWLMLREA